MKVKSDGRPGSFKVSAEGEGLVSHAGSAPVAEVADRVGITKGLGEAIDAKTQRKALHNRGKAVLDIAVAIVDGADCLKDVDAVVNRHKLTHLERLKTDCETTNHPLT